MQTFLPYPDYAESARALDYRRLGKQRIEVVQLLAATSIENYPLSGWRNHPAAHMWRGYRSSLAAYGLIVCNEWRDRGYRDSQFWIIWRAYDPLRVVDPPWLDDEEFNIAHQSNLLRKDYQFYQEFKDVGMELPYIWPEGRDMQTEYDEGYDPGKGLETPVDYSGTTPHEMLATMVKHMAEAWSCSVSIDDLDRGILLVNLQRLSTKYPLREPLLKSIALGDEAALHPELRESAHYKLIDNALTRIWQENAK